MSKRHSPGNSDYEHGRAAYEFKQNYSKGTLPSDVYSNGDDYQRMTDGWISCMVIVAVPVLAVLATAILLI